ncbi:MAG TPA: hypothetical protein ENN69_03690 [Spirochaetia bacterium]|nr:hypothetical protein [Spirochaetia bacterium]
MIGIDWFNVVITIESYLKGALLFTADDGVIRDAAKVHGSYRESALTERALNLLLDTLTEQCPRRLDFFLDSPISHSKRIRDDLEVTLRSRPGKFSFSLTLAPSADYCLKNYAGLAASSDSVIIDHCREVIDLPAIVLSARFSFTAPPLSALFP